MELMEYLQLAVNGGAFVVIVWMVYHVFTKLLPDRDIIVKSIVDRFSADQQATRASFEASLDKVVAHCSQEAKMLHERYEATLDRLLLRKEES